MNKLIEKLKEQAEIKFEAHPQHMGIDTAVITPADLEKFAELIVKECTDIALKKGMASPDTDFRTGSYVINQYLLTHFGVE